MAVATREIIINAPIDEVFGFWKNFENFPRFMENIESISVTGPETTHWKMRGPLGVPVEWHAKTTYIEENKKISWQSTGGTIENHGSVLFAEIEGGRTKVTVGLEYKTPGGAVGEALAKLLSDPDKQLAADLLRFKRVVQTDEAEFLMDEATAADGGPASDHTAER